ncbi:MAG: N-acyl-D-aspartate/D-glutamate deacylase [Alphaproteobacteria bacterium]|jgi:N-acyl-D-aspartate/D-glutamate deacylase
MTHDLVIRGGSVADGRGAPLFEADVAVENGKIVAIGEIVGSGKEEIDARGKLVAPGWVDIHSHYDGQALFEDRLLSSGWHGATTTVMGNCGVGFAPLKAGDRQLLIELMEGVEDIPASVLDEGLDWDWHSFEDFLQALERRRHDMDICAQLPHSAVRVYVMGERAMRREVATADDIAQMRAITAEAIRSGALGFTTSRTLNHRTVAGEPIPSWDAAAEELTGIVMGLRDAGAGVMQLISDLTPERRPSEFALMRGMMEASGRPLSITILQQNRDPDGWKDFMNMIDSAVADGLPMRAQIAPRPIGTLFGLDLGRHGLCYHPSYKKIEDKSLAERVAIMRDASFRAQLLSEKPEHDIDQLIRRVRNFDYQFPFNDPPDYAPPREASVAATAERTGKSVDEIVYDLLLEEDGMQMIFSPNNNFANYSLDACREQMENPNSIISLSDGGAHVAHICDVSYSTYLLTYWGRDRAEGALDVSWLIKRMTGDSAAAVGLLDRGVLAPGYKADINVIDHEKLTIRKPLMVHDLPLGAKRLIQKADGYVATVKSGEITYRDGEATDALPGGLVRGAQAAPKAT